MRACAGDSPVLPLAIASDRREAYKATNSLPACRPLVHGPDEQSHCHRSISMLISPDGDIYSDAKSRTSLDGCECGPWIPSTTHSNKDSRMHVAPKSAANHTTVNEQTHHPRCARRKVFTVFLCFVVCQLFVNFDSGAIPSVLQLISAEFELSSLKLGVIGALPYVGLTVASPIVGRCIQSSSQKRMIVASIILNSLAAVMLSCSFAEPALLLSRFLLGLTQSGFCIYAPVWVDEFAPEPRLTLWMGILQGATVLGVMLGYVSAGFVASLGHNWRFAIATQAVVLAAFGLAFLCTPRRFLDIYNSPPPFSASNAHSTSAKNSESSSENVSRLFSSSEHAANDALGEDGHPMSITPRHLGGAPLIIDAESNVKSPLEARGGRSPTAATAKSRLPSKLSWLSILASWCQGTKDRRDMEQMWSSVGTVITHVTSGCSVLKDECENPNDGNAVLGCGISQQFDECPGDKEDNSSTPCHSTMQYGMQDENRLGVQRNAMPTVVPNGGSSERSMTTTALALSPAMSSDIKAIVGRKQPFRTPRKLAACQRIYGAAGRRLPLRQRCCGALSWCLGNSSAVCPSTAGHPLPLRQNSLGSVLSDCQSTGTLVKATSCATAAKMMNHAASGRVREECIAVRVCIDPSELDDDGGVVEPTCVGEAVSVPSAVENRDALAKGDWLGGEHDGEAPASSASLPNIQPNEGDFWDNTFAVPSTDSLAPSPAVSNFARRAPTLMTPSPAGAVLEVLEVAAHYDNPLVIIRSAAVAPVPTPSTSATPRAFVRKSPRVPLLPLNSGRRMAAQATLNSNVHLRSHRHHHPPLPVEAFVSDGDLEDPLAPPPPQLLAGGASRRSRAVGEGEALKLVGHPRTAAEIAPQTSEPHKSGLAEEEARNGRPQSTPSLTHVTCQFARGADKNEQQRQRQLVKVVTGRVSLASQSGSVVRRRITSTVSAAVHFDLKEGQQENRAAKCKSHSNDWTNDRWRRAVDDVSYARVSDSGCANTAVGERRAGLDMPDEKLTVQAEHTMGIETCPRKLNDEADNSLGGTSTSAQRPISHSLFVDDTKDAYVSTLGLTLSLCRNPIYLWVVFTLCALLYVVTGVQYWATVYLTVVIEIPLEVVIAAFSATAATAPTVGVLVGGAAGDFIGGYKSTKNMVQTLAACSVAALLATASGIIASFSRQFVCIITCVWLLLFFGGAMLPSTTGILIASVDPRMRAFASGMSMFTYNVFGYALGSFLPGAVMNVVGLEHGMKFVFFWAIFGVVGAFGATICAYRSGFAAEEIVFASDFPPLSFIPPAAPSPAVTVRGESSSSVCCTTSVVIEDNPSHPSSLLLGSFTSLTAEPSLNYSPIQTL